METYMLGFSSFTLHSPSLLQQIRFSPPFGAVKNRNRERGAVWKGVIEEKRRRTRQSVRAAVGIGIGIGMEAARMIVDAIKQDPPTWGSAMISNAVILTAGSPLLFLGLTIPGVVSAFLLATLSWRAFGSHGFLLVVTYYLIGTVVTKIKMKQKESEGIAEKRKGRRGPNSVLGSGLAGCICALASIYQIGGPALESSWLIGFVASYCTKLSDTVSSEIGKAYGKTTYLITNFKIVPRGTEGAVSVEGTLAGLVASALLAYSACLMGQLDGKGISICIISSQLANVLESQIGAVFQDKEGYEWLNNDIVNVINITCGAALAIFLKQFLS